MYPSPNIIRMIKSRGMRCSGNIARMGEEECIYDFGLIFSFCSELLVCRFLFPLGLTAYKVLMGLSEGKRPL
jgi:hypothetical protein